MEYELGETTRRLLEERSKAGCFLCRRILEALDERGVLRDWPVDTERAHEGAVDFPVDGQRYHVLKEKEGKA